MNKIFFGDCRETLKRLAEDGVKAQMCVTSPPYFGLRDYGVDGQIGLEQTPDEYIANMVEVFRCVRDVLADDGTLWVSIGDSYSGQRGTQPGRVSGSGAIVSGQGKGAGLPPGLKPKDLIGIPWLLAFALRSDGWHLRQDIIWHKPNPMPESVRDRCTKAHEYVFLLSESDRYFYDQEAIKEPAVYADCGRPSKKKGDFLSKGEPLPGQLPFRAITETRNRRSVWTVAVRPYKGAHFAVFPPALIEPCILAGSLPGDIVLDPFMGSGTTAEVALLNGRQYIGCELNQGYEQLQQARIKSALAATSQNNLI